MLLISIILTAALLYLAYSDFRNREISLLALLAGIVLAGIRSYSFNEFHKGLNLFLLNSLGCILILSVSILIIFLVRRKIFNPLNTILGSGDLVFLPIVCLSFSPVNFLIFIIGSLAFALCLKIIFFRKTKTIPLAGVLAIPLSIVVFAEGILNQSISYNDLPVLQYIYGN